VAFAWLLVLAAGLLIGSRVFARLDTGNGLRGDAESSIATERIDQLTRSGPQLSVLVDGRAVRDPALAASVKSATTNLRSMPEVSKVIDAASSRVPGLVATDGRAQLLQIELRDGLSRAQVDAAEARIRSEVGNIDAPRILIGGQNPAQREFQDGSRRDLERGEMFALPLVILLLLLIFRGFVALTLPLIVAVVSVSGALLILLEVSQLTSISVYSVNVVTMVGLGLAVDYALLVVSRFREERAAGHGAEAAIERTLRTAGRTVAFSGLTVMVALAGLLLFAEPFLRSLAWGAMGVVLVTMAAALSLLPALLAMWGRRIRPLASSGGDHGLFYRISRLVQRFAIVLVPLLVIGLVLLAAPFRNAKLENSGFESLPASSPSRQVFETVRDRFPGGGSDPVVAVADLSPFSPEAADLANRIKGLPGATTVQPRIGLPPTITVLDVTPRGPSQGDAATRLVREIRGLERPATVQVTGSAAFLVDYRDSLAGRLPFALGLIALATFALLFLMTGSVVVPIKAILMNVLSLGASFGALVWIFQEGHLADPLRFTPVGHLDITVPVLVFVFAFGLSMDYEVFLLSRIKETYDETGDNDRAVALGLQRTGRIVTSAAALVVLVFLGFATGDLLTIKEIGIGMALAIVVDATVVRTLLVPAAMKLMGRWNWWAPAPMRRLHSRIALRERFEPPEPPEPAERLERPEPERPEPERPEPERPGAAEPEPEGVRAR
jgi:putative drug exporter of the RND superfamily